MIVERWGGRSTSRPEAIGAVRHGPCADEPEAIDDEDDDDNDYGPQ